MLFGGGMLFLLVFVFSFYSPTSYTVYKVSSSPLSEEVLASGSVEGVSNATFGFKNQGKVTKIAVAVGDVVTKGQELALQDTSSFDSQLAEMEAGIRVQRARVNQSKAGMSSEDIAVADAAVSGASTEVKNAETAYLSVKQQLLIELKNAYTSADDAIRNKADKLFTNPQSDSPKLVIPSSSDFKLGTTLETSRKSIEKELLAWEQEIEVLSTEDDLLLRGATTKAHLQVIKQFLSQCSLFVNNPNNITGSLSLTEWNTLKADIASGRGAIDTSIASIASYSTSLTQAESQVSGAKSALKTSTKQLDLKKASVRSTDLAVYEAQLAQAIASKKRVESLRDDLVITAPFTGMVTDISFKVGEVSGGLMPGALSLLSYDRLQIKANIVENNIVKVKQNQKVRIIFEADTSRTFSGTVTTIDPAQKEISGTVYYQATITVDDQVDFLRPGMTANVWIATRYATSTIAIPLSAAHKEQDGWYVTTLSSSQQKEIKKVELGFKDGNGKVQVLSGLEEGEQVILEEHLK